MIRLTEIKLPLDHNEDAIGQAIIEKLQINPEQLNSYNVSFMSLFGVLADFNRSQ